MAPKKSAIRKKSHFMEQGQGSGANLEPNWELEQTNRYLFRDVMGYENYMYSFANRTLSKCYYFDKATVTFRQPEDDKIINFITHWNWHSVLSCNESFTKLLTRIFYANMRFQENPFMLTTWVCGQEIALSLGNLAGWLDVPNDGEETYLLRGWTQMALGTPDHYKIWFDRNNRGGAPIYVSNLPSLHRLLFTFINNILIPKATLKTNLEWGLMYYLRHIIQMDKTFNIPYIILRHMRSVLKSTVASLPYANLIHKIIRANGIEIPEGQLFEMPIHLVDHLTKIGWVQQFSDSGLRCYVPDQRDINAWINAENASPNQYWDPDEGPQAAPQEQAPPVNPQPNMMPPMGPFVLPPNPAAQMEFLCREMYAQRIASQAMQRDLQQIRARVNRNYKEIGLLHESQASLMR